MARTDRRTAEQIREEIRAERAQIDAALAALRADAKRLGLGAGSLLAALASLRAVARLRGRRRAR